ncbi:MAG: adenylyltransferase/cytidyltransferase family protein [Lachnospiraceae bacterium]|nr:adenylyltransferase/cytidyltransferase family protein [Lachnospiraceae bacterium]
MLEYELPRKELVLADADDKAAQKKYNVGYIAGVFDLFHIGHLNMFKRAKEQCRYLIVGVVSDEQVMREKKTMPVISFEERLEIVQSCRYVDEAVEIPIDRPSTEDAFRRYHFDVQFSGSDYENNPTWLSQKTYLQQHGSDIVFFPYTQSVSSTQLKKKLKKHEEMQ